VGMIPSTPSLSTMGSALATLKLGQTRLDGTGGGGSSSAPSSRSGTPLGSRLPARPAGALSPALSAGDSQRHQPLSTSPLPPGIPRSVSSPHIAGGMHQLHHPVSLQVPALSVAAQLASASFDIDDDDPPLIVNGRRVEGVHRRRPRPGPTLYDSSRDECDGGVNDADKKQKKDGGRMSKPRIIRRSRSMPIVGSSSSCGSVDGFGGRSSDEGATSSLLAHGPEEEEVVEASLPCQAMFEESVRKKRGASNVVKAELSFAAQNAARGSRKVGASLRNLTNRITCVSASAAVEKEGGLSRDDDEVKVGFSEGKEPKVQLMRASGCLA